ncbi:hypothetical protein JGI1_00015 [Candidatus Thermokryptus mobilis]|uniref:MetA-pathway of phenol degradation n=1 Tax=Candidatus Thermokryptus mobilis TaxID=1643428 RepID=A0A0S4MNT7_9BACT|nr:hypothetical protein [Candidatus Thermokryptus mobilis]CUU00580.1 hypothetical protein JGI1_00015 [Candidatus Thermokryptus mobilis]
MKRFLFTVAILALITTTAYPCFDTYLFLKRGSMVYPFRSLVFELNGEYSINSLSLPGEDTFLSMGSIYYGLAQNFSLQFTLGSDEKVRNEFKIDYYGISGVYNLYSTLTGSYTLDLIFAHRGKLNEKSNEFEISIPNIFRASNFTYVIHPTASYGLESKEFTLGAHAGIFYTFNEIGIIGVGAEYASVHSSSYAGQRLTKSEYSTSVFFGARIGERFYLQNEIAKGLANSRDIGFAITAKVIL